MDESGANIQTPQEMKGSILLGLPAELSAEDVTMNVKARLGDDGTHAHT